MMQRLFFILLIISPVGAFSQFTPADGQSLHYRIVNFIFPGARTPKQTTKIEIALGDYRSDGEFARHVSMKQVCRKNEIIIDLPNWNANYTWRVTRNNNHNNNEVSQLHHFSTALDKRIDTTKTRLRILQAALGHANDYVISEDGGIIYDMSGAPVWYLPIKSDDNSELSDIKITNDGTITFLLDQTGYDVNYDGQVLWRTPAHDSAHNDTGADYYHHEFTKLANGNYMVLGTDFFWYKALTYGDSSYFELTPDRSKHNKYNGGAGAAFSRKPWAKNRGRYGVIVELDKTGNVVWSWKSADYLQASDYAYYWPKDTSLRYEPHENAFFFDMAHHAIYLSYRQLSRIIKIDYPSGKVLASYGEKFKPGEIQKNDFLFCNQHSIRKAKNGELYLFNNNTCNGPTALPSVLFMHEPETANGTLRKVWEYKCDADGLTPGFPSGGIATELSDGDIFVCMGSAYGKLMIVNKNKMIQWSALPEIFNATKNKWEPPAKTYRAAIISRQELEKMIKTSSKSYQ